MWPFWPSLNGKKNNVMARKTTSRLTITYCRPKPDTADRRIRSINHIITSTKDALSDAATSAFLAALSPS